MFGSVVLDVAIGMSFVYLLLSLIASVLQEMLAAFLQLRPANLLRGIRSLFSGDSLFGQDLVDALYTHGLVRGLYSDPKEDLKQRQPSPTGAVGLVPAVTQPIGTKPPTRLDTIRTWLRGVVGMKIQTEVRGIYDQSLLPAYIPARTFSLAMTDILNVQNATGDQIMKSITDSLAAHGRQWQDNKAGQALYTLALNAQGDLTKFQASLENWYNDSMDRVSGWYKRHIQRILFILGLTLAVFFNVDSVRVAETLWHDRDARQAMASATTAYMQNHSAPAPAAPTAAAADSTSAPASASSELGDLQKKLGDTVGAFDNVTNTALLPVGWKVPPLDYLKRFHKFVFTTPYPDGTLDIVGDTLWKILILLFGWTVTGLAISLGAPFWFDTLNKFMVVRSTIKPQEKSQTDPSKDN
jgi:hypothetical protein